MPMFQQQQNPSVGAFGNIDPNVIAALLRQHVMQQQQQQAVQASGGAQQTGPIVGGPQIPGTNVQNGGIHPMQGGAAGGQLPQMPNQMSGISNALLGTPASNPQNQGLLSQLQALLGLKNSGLTSGMPSGQGQ